MSVAKRTLIAAVFASAALVSVSCDSTSPTFVRELAVSIQAGGNVLGVGESVQAKAVLHWSDGREEDVTTAAAWEPVNASVVTVSASGLVTALAVGNTNVRATYNRVRGEMSFTVR